MFQILSTSNTLSKIKRMGMGNFSNRSIPGPLHGKKNLPCKFRRELPMYQILCQPNDLKIYSLSCAFIVYTKSINSLIPLHQVLAYPSVILNEVIEEKKLINI